VFKKFDISGFKKIKPPASNTFDAMQEIKALNKIPLNKKFVKDYDNIEGAFEKTAKEQGLGDYDKKIAAKLINDSAPVIIKLKEHFNRPRPKQSARKMNVKMKDIEMNSMKTASYPSGHSAQGILIGKVLGDKYPKAKSAFNKTAKNISYSRQVAHAHYKSDSVMGEKLGAAMYDYTKT
jgi:hypothetical protein|tara:strand:- start:457 stop:993 length:537 start_codon:yes stop_codon:yes gene_type:complete